MGRGLITVPVGAEHVRVDRFVADATGLTRCHVQRLIADGRLTDAAGRPLRANTIVGPGARMTLEVPPPVPLDLAPEPSIELRVVYEDGDLLIVDKRAGLVVHPSPGHPDGTLVNALLARDTANGGIARCCRR